MTPHRMVLRGACLALLASACHGQSSKLAQPSRDGAAPSTGAAGAGTAGTSAAAGNTGAAGVAGAAGVTTGDATAPGDAATLPAPHFPLKLGPAGSRTLVDQSGQPFLMWAEAAWSLVVQPSLADAGSYLDDRQKKGFNTVLVNLIEHKFAAKAPADFAGNAPFTGRPFATPNPAYFADADAVIKAAAAHDMLVLVAPLYLGYECNDEGWCTDVMSASTADLTSWGNFIGKRYASFDNILWVIGGDMDPTPVADKVRAFVDGVLAFDTRHLMTAHNERGTMAITHWPNETWLNVNDFYTSTDVLVTDAQSTYAHTPTMPFFMIEAIYENEHDSTTQQERSQAYWTMLSGAMGHVFGNCPLWNFGLSTTFCDGTDWKAQLSSPASISMSYAARLLASRPWQTLVPDTNHTAVTAGVGDASDSSYVTAARASDGATVMAYVPVSHTITVDMTSLSGTQARAWWYDPTSAVATSSGTYPTTGSKTFTPPKASGDWVFVLDDDARGFAAPGSK